MNTAFLGLGAIGRPMAARIAGAGLPLTVWNRTAARAEEFVRDTPTVPRVRLAATAAEAARGADVVVSCFSTSHDVEGVLDGPDGLLAGLARGATLVDCTSGDPATSRRIAARLAAVGADFLDAPVSGGVIGAEKGTLTTMVGGAADVLERVRPVLATFAQKIVHCGAVGAGDTVKAVNQAFLAIHLLSAAEGLATLMKEGVDPKVALDVINSSSGRSNASMNLIPERVLTRAFPRTFKLALLEKDIAIAAGVGARQSRSGAADGAHRRPLSHCAQRVRRGGRPCGDREAHRTVGERGDRMTATLDRTAASIASVDAIRAHFPALERVHRGFPVAYFDGPGGTQVPRVVAAAMTDYLFHHNANTHWAYPTSEETDALIAGARQTLADFVNGRADEIAFGQNMTSLTFHLAHAIGRSLGPGDEIVVTELDHHGNVAPWRAVEKDRGVTLRMVKMRTSDGQLDWSDLEAAITPRTKVLAIGAASNALGTITDVARATRLAHAVGARVFVDAVHYAPHVLVDVQAIGCDFLACSAYKFYGSHIGILWGKRELIEQLDAPRLEPAPQESPERLETGTQNHEGIVGAAAAVDFLASLASLTAGAGGTHTNRRAALRATFDALHARGESLLEKMWTGLAAVDGLTLYGPKPGTPRTPTLSFTLRGRSTTDVARSLAARGLFVSNGDFYATTIVERLGLVPDGLVRVGCSCYTSEEEVGRLVDAVSVVR